MLCDEALAVNQDDTHGQASILRCKRWSCELCQQQNRWKVIQAIHRGKPTKMVTFTCKHSNYSTPDEAAADMKRGLRALRKRLARHFPNQKFPMLVVFEAHKSGWPHMHIALRSKFISVKWLQTAWSEILGAWNVDIRPFPKDVRKAAYFAKYLGKDLHHFAGCKRWWRSHDYEVEAAEDRIKVRFGDVWQTIYGQSFNDYVQQLKRNPMFHVAEERPGYVRFHRWWIREGSP